MVGSIVNRIQELGIEVQHIPGGCRHLCQPNDVGLNRPIKRRLPNNWRIGCFNGGGVDAGVAKISS
jgi:hypothetical protein